jgi:lipopolysaccharide transport system permease protein
MSAMELITRRLNLSYLRDLLYVLVGRDMKLRYRRSVIGVAWSLLNPLAQLLVLNFVFRRVLPLDIPNYTVFLFTGLLAWNWFSTSLYSATGAIVENRELVKRPGFPAPLLPVVSLTSNFFHFLLALPVLLFFTWTGGIPLTRAALALPLVFAVQFIFTLSMAYLVAGLHVTFRDTQYLLGIFLLLGFYLSPVFYEPSAIPASYQSIYRLNPMVVLIDTYRRILISGQPPDGAALLSLAVISAVLLWLGYLVFERSSLRFVEEL